MPKGLRRSIPAVFAALVLLATAGSAGAQPVPTKGGGEPHKPRIVGGVESDPGAWPSQVALLQHGMSDRYQAQFCGGTVLSPSWILTAAHCVFEEDGSRTPPGNIDVLAGTQDLTTGGERVRAVEVRTPAGFDLTTLHYDVALIRLDRPVQAPPMPIVSQGKGIAPDTDLVTTGWGNQSATDNDFPKLLREVDVPYVSDSACRAAYPVGADQVFLDTMFCAGLVGEGGKDSCNGDSGGPISAKLGGTWTQVGIVSWGLVCADPDFPGVYTRLAAFSNGIKGQIRYGAQPDGASFVRQQYRDLVGHPPTARQLFLDTLTVRSGSLSDYDATLVAGPGWQHSAGGVARLYKAYFGRDADRSGLAYWVGRVLAGTSLNAVSSSFAASSEFTSTYGALADDAFVALVYQNVLGRPGDAGGVAYWTDQLTTKAASRGQVMTGFSESREYRTATRARTDLTITYFGLLRRVPTAEEYTTWTGKANVELIRSILGSVEYAARF